MSSQLNHESTTFIKKQFPITLVCDRVNAPANIGSIFRIADSFGVEHIYFCGEDITVISKRMERTARSTHHFVAYQQNENIIEVLDDLQNKGYQLIGLEITNDSIEVANCNFSKTDKIALIIGEENLGISETVLARLTKSVHINMYGQNSSMNVATATGIALYEITKQLMIDLK
ncbi:TrmH family RNA methyltransferase [Aquimarina litoralis]|uniref:TrmH family RNA methyltransferase n=1 Tax=Aquimarina litoralis TaxID=584605 RepID=UPI001C5946F8|nr:TrmH family RNA methyltransferase [Aquimarina litoralis]MBW1297189.1 TrmH family RNA methyltransferase [Aquimarina litoralis]